MLRLFATFGLFLCTNTALKAQAPAAVIPGDFADPSIIKTSKGYFATGTSSEWAPHYPIYSSADLKTWKQVGYVFDKAPDWTAGSFWAPEYYFHNNTYYLYYTARRKSDNVSCIGVATSKYPDRGFKDHGIIVSFGKEAIDAFVNNVDGQLYMTFKVYGLDKRPIELVGSRVSADGLKLEGDIFPMLKDDEGIGMEGQSILKHGNYFYLFYSAGNCCGSGCSYHVRVARSKDFRGPYEKYSTPVLETLEAWKCPGHGTFALQPNGKYVYLYHAYNEQNTVFTGREGMLADLIWPTDENGWPSFVNRPPAGNTVKNITASFKEKTVPGYWQWDFRHASPVVSQQNGKLSLSGETTANNPTGVVLTVRPVSKHFDMTTTVSNANAAVKGLAFYGDANAAIGIGSMNDWVEFWIVKDNKRRVIATEHIKPGVPVQLKFSMLPDLTCEVAYKQADGEWQALGGKEEVKFLPQWDRSPRAGLHVKGGKEDVAEFSGFELINK